MEDKLADPAKVDAYTRFVRASMKGWQYALDNPTEAAQIVVDSDETGAADLDHQKYMMSEVAKLIDAPMPALDIDTYDRTVKALEDQKIICRRARRRLHTVVTDALK
jgi:NitT/TauT family transport system substrate-binding protein